MNNYIKLPFFALAVLVSYILYPLSDKQIVEKFEKEVILITAGAIKKIFERDLALDIKRLISQRRADSIRDKLVAIHLINKHPEAIVAANYHNISPWAFLLCVRPVADEDLDSFAKNPSINNLFNIAISAKLQEGCASSPTITSDYAYRIALDRFLDKYHKDLNGPFYLKNGRRTLFSQWVWEAGLLDYNPRYRKDKYSFDGLVEYTELMNTQKEVENQYQAILKYGKFIPNRLSWSEWITSFFTR